MTVTQRQFSPNGDTEPGFRVEGDTSRRRPDTMKYCTHCDEHVPRSRWRYHEHHHDPSELDDDDPVVDDEDDDDPVQVGAEYTVRIQKNVTWSFTFPAGYEGEAEEKAKEMIEYGNATDAHTLHVEVDEGEPIYEDDPEADEHDLYL